MIQARSLSPVPAARFWGMHGWLFGVAWLAIAALPACRELSRAPDGTPIVPMQNEILASDTIRTRAGTFTIRVEAWTDRMPSPRRKPGETPGFPLYVAVRVACVDGEPGSSHFQLSALSLWLDNGDSLLATFPLVTVSGHPPVLEPDCTVPVELTNDRTRPRYSEVAPETPVSVALLVVDGGGKWVARLTDIAVIAAY